MGKKRVLSIFGSRPDAIKTAPIILALEQSPDFESVVCVTAEQRQYLDQVLQLFSIEPQYDLNLIQPGQLELSISGTVLSGIENVCDEVNPDLVLIQGDSTTAVCGALTAFQKKIPICHVEAGIRSGSLKFPWPNEGNRRLISSIASYHFASTEISANNLYKEGVDRARVFISGNPGIDSCMKVNDMFKEGTKSFNTIEQCYPELDSLRTMLLVTCDCEKTFSGGYEECCNLLMVLAERFPDVDIVFPAFVRPDKLETVNMLFTGYPNIYFMKPQDYLPFVYLMNRSHLILTDSGGIKEEAPYLGKPVLVLGDNTDRPETVLAGTSRLVGVKVGAIVSSVEKLLSDPTVYAKMSKVIEPYGDGQAAVRIVEELSGIGDFQV